MLKFIITIACLLGLNTVLVSQILPSDIANLNLWLKSDQGVITSGNNVTNWSNSSALGNDAFQDNPIRQPEFLNNVTEINDKPALLFEGSEFIAFPKINTIRTLFVVASKDNNSSNSIIPLLGDTTSFDFHGNSGTIYAPGNASGNVTGGQTRINSTLINGSSENYPNDFFLLSLVTLADVKASNFASDRILDNRTWNGNLAELIIYNRALSENEVLSIENYLSNKYHPLVNLPDTIYQSDLCDTTLNVNAPWLTSYQWGDSNGELTSETSSSFNISESGIYTISTENRFGKTFIDTFHLKFPITDLKSATTICLGDTIEANLGVDDALHNILWNTNDTTSKIDISDEGNYSATIIDQNMCTYNTNVLSISIDSFSNNYMALAESNIDLCSGNKIEILPASENVSYNWSDNTSDTALTVNNSGTFYVTVSNAINCQVIDSINVNIKGTAPLTAFNVNNIACNNEAVQFTDQSSSADQSNLIDWQWNFNDGGISTIPNPSHLFSNSGTFTVVLTLTTDSGCTNTTSQIINVFEKPEADFNYSNEFICSENPVNFNNNSTTPSGILTNITWKFNNVDSSSQSNPSYAFSEGTSEVIMIVENNFGCKDTTNQTLNILASPKADFFFNASCENDSSQFIDNSTGNISSFNWNFNNTNLSSAPNPEIVFTSANIQYAVSLIVTDVNGCIDDTTKIVSPYPQPSANYSNSNPICKNTKIIFEGNSDISSGEVTNHKWLFNQNNSPAELEGNLVEYNTDETGFISLSLIAISERGCVDTANFNIEALDKPTAAFSASRLFAEPNSIIELNNESEGEDNIEWILNEEIVATTGELNYLLTDTGVFSISLIAISSNGCTDTASKNIFSGEIFSDVSISNLSLVKNELSNNYSVIAEVINLGNTPVFNFNITANIYNNNSVSEAWSSNSNSLQPFGRVLYVFNAKFGLEANELPRNICVTLSKPNGIVDTDISNNTFCLSNNSSFSLDKIYPNPTQESLNLEFFVDQQGEYNLDVYDAQGNRVVHNEINANEGLNTHNLVVLNLRAGNFQIVLSNNEKQVRALFTKINTDN